MSKTRRLNPTPQTTSGTLPSPLVFDTLALGQGTDGLLGGGMDLRDDLQDPLQQTETPKPSRKRGAESLGQVPLSDTSGQLQKKVPLTDEQTNKPLQAQPAKGVWVNIKSGKVSTDWTSGDDKAPSKDHVWMTHDEFVTFKNAGKRTKSEKFTDKLTGTNYFSSDQQDWYGDKEKTNKLDPQKVPVSSLLNRTRQDRTSQSIALHDVSPYQVASDKEVVGDNMEHDHVPSGESTKQRINKEIDDEFEVDLQGRTDSFRGKGKSKGEDWGYQNALSIEIRGNDHPEGWDHNAFSPTWGHRQHIPDTLVDENDGQLAKMSRKKMDAELPGYAFHRDVDSMLTNTHGIGRTDELQQVGAYRKLYKENVKQENVNPESPAYHVIQGDPLLKKSLGGGLTIQKDKGGKKQGEVTDGMLRGHIRQRVSKPQGLQI